MPDTYSHAIEPCGKFQAMQLLKENQGAGRAPLVE